ncbi:hypothetical protein AMAG_12041 [Allomyces macrogynus ATCC 38327]|uniref:PH domain-containing protein n=1 Tax=Allomyces macrogynus (strain ATCC 38327) TaxID=578462 RepID=A0A0L0SYV9_ALLM3|nr:hypothetical protein AMAG_12041 [Allomyces macrogynus ATCC 38327]|eukprot:KNE67590.1 hypothetical protein AMAG_12041 [Allomyces macrogynus ATCC 38327]
MNLLSPGSMGAYLPRRTRSKSRARSKSRPRAAVAGDTTNSSPTSSLHADSASVWSSSGGRGRSGSFTPAGTPTLHATPLPSSNMLDSSALDTSCSAMDLLDGTDEDDIVLQHYALLATSADEAAPGNMFSRLTGSHHGSGKRRYFVLFMSGRLDYYKSRDRKDVRGSVSIRDRAFLSQPDLSRCQLHLGCSPAHGRSTSDDDMVHLWLTFEDQWTMDMWAKELRQIIARRRDEGRRQRGGNPAAAEIGMSAEDLKLLEDDDDDDEAHGDDGVVTDFDDGSAVSASAVGTAAPAAEASSGQSSPYLPYRPRASSTRSSESPLPYGVRPRTSSAASTEMSAGGVPYLRPRTSSYTSGTSSPALPPRGMSYPPPPPPPVPAGYPDNGGMNRDSAVVTTPVHATYPTMPLPPMPHAAGHYAHHHGHHGESYYSTFEDDRTSAVSAPVSGSVYHRSGRHRPLTAGPLPPPPMAPAPMAPLPSLPRPHKKQAPPMSSSPSELDELEVQMAALTAAVLPPRTDSAVASARLAASASVVMDNVDGDSAVGYRY